MHIYTQKHEVCYNHCNRNAVIFMYFIGNFGMNNKQYCNIFILRLIKNATEVQEVMWVNGVTVDERRKWTQYVLRKRIRAFPS
jgi:poly(3-hydroxyalkanoate) synthetase